ncbi:MAG: DMT family transporter [Clostridia bacterium]|nr:DMT family transporter [Clostridia bacterium]
MACKTSQKNEMTNQQGHPIPIRAILMAVFCNILFGSAFPMIKIGYTCFGIGDDAFVQILFAGIRFLIAGVFVFLVTLGKDRRVPRIAKGNGGMLLLVAVFYTFLQYIFFYIGLSNTSGASGSVMNATSTFIAVILAHFIYPDDRLTAGKIVGVLLGFAGVLFAVLVGDGMGGFSPFGEGFILISATCFVIGSVLNKKATKRNDSFTVTAYNLMIGGALLITLGLLGGGATLTFRPMGVLVLLYLAMVSAVGFTIWSTLLRKYPVGEISIYNFVIPISGTILSSLFLRENIFKWQFLLALALVCAGIIFVNRKKT